VRKCFEGGLSPCELSGPRFGFDSRGGCRAFAGIDMQRGQRGFGRFGSSGGFSCSADLITDAGVDDIEFCRQLWMTLAKSGDWASSRVR
jgi:hypothetical protein